MKMRRWMPRIVAGAVVAGLAGGCGRPVVKPPAPTPPIVLISSPVTREVTDYEEFTGRMEAVQSIDVRARVTGYLDKVNFVDGIEVAANALLFEIDPRPYKAKFDFATADLASKEAAESRAKADYQRNQAAYNKGALAELDLIHFKTDFDTAHAAVEAARATLYTANLDLEFTKVAAPIAGRMSRRMVDPGNLVKADDTILTSIVSLDPMYIYFDVDERTVLRLRALVRAGKVPSRETAEIPVLVGLVNEDGYPHVAKLNFSDNRVDNTTGTLRLRAVLANPRPERTNIREFAPGLFARVRLRVGFPHQAVLVTEKALGTDQGRKFAYVVDDKNVVQYRPLKVGTVVDGLRVIEEGLKPGERVIVSGLQRVQPKSKVSPKPDDTPPLEAVANAKLPSVVRSSEESAPKARPSGG